MSKPRTHSYDSECERLARHFLDEEIAAGRAKPADIMDLAEVIQAAVDVYFSVVNQPRHLKR